MAYDWESIAKQVGDIRPDGEFSSTDSGRRALELILGEDNIRSTVDYWIALKPGCFTGEMVLNIIRSKVARERCYEVYRANRDKDTQIANRAVGLLASMAEPDVLPWIAEFLDVADRNVRWNGLAVLQNVFYGPLNDSSESFALQLLTKAESDSDSEIKKRATELRASVETNRP